MKTDIKSRSVIQKIAGELGTYGVAPARAEVLAVEWYDVIVQDVARKTQQMAIAEAFPHELTESIEQPEDRLAAAIMASEKKNKIAIKQYGLSAQISCQAEVDTLRWAFAIATGTEVGGMEFNTRLGMAISRSTRKEMA